MRISGIGTTFLGISKADKNGIASATRWFTFIYFPIFPFARIRVRFLPHKGSGFSYQIISKEKLILKEILITYLYGWFLYPLVIAFPAIFAIKEIWQWLGLPESFQIVYLVLAIIWAIFWIWKLMDWQDERCRPTK